MFEQKNGALCFSRRGERVCVQAVGRDGLRVRATMFPRFDGADWALAGALPHDAETEIGEGGATVRNGRIRCEITPLGQMRFYKDDTPVLCEYYRMYCYDSPHTPSLRVVAREFTPVRGGDYRLVARFEANEGEKLFGMGQYQQPWLDVKGCSLELAQRNSQASVPFVLSSLGYGFFWNNPAVGRADFAKNVTEWAAESAKQLDYYITVADTPKQLVENYTALVGRAPAFPESLLGLWQCKLRYRTQEEVLEVAREYHRRGIPLDLIVIDFFHWTRQGDWKFDPKYWPDPAAMVRELKSYGTRCMVSVWPTVDKKSENFAEMDERGLLIRPERGNQCFDFLGDSYVYDATNPEARAYIWKKCREHYYESGIDLFWLDEAEPEYTTYQFDNYRYHSGTALQTANVYPVCHAQAFYEGQRAAGQEEVCNPVSYTHLSWFAALGAAADACAGALEGAAAAETLAARLQTARALYFIGRGTDRFTAAEGALKVREIAYVFAESCPAGELKHGTLALVEEGFPVIAVATGRALLQKTANSLAEAKARGAFTVLFSQYAGAAGGADVVCPLPALPEPLMPLVSVIPLQQFACRMCLLRGFDPDRPRNLAKSVTVE